MEEKTSVKKNAADLLDKALSLHARKNRYGFIVLASSTDPYLQMEENMQVTRKCLEVILKYKFPVHIITKSSLVKRDFDLLKKIDKVAILPEDLKGKISGTLITFSFSSIDPGSGKIFESGAPSPSERLLTMKSASESGFLTGVSLMPLLPFISDTDEQLEKMISSFANYGAKYIMPAGLTLFGNSTSDSRTLTLDKIKTYYPQLLTEYEKLFSSHDYPSNEYSARINSITNSIIKKYSLRNRILPLS
jgi:DNA repair photolyase